MKIGFQLSKLIKKIQSTDIKKSVPTVEIRIPISATEKYLRMVHYFLESLQLFGGPIGRQAKCVVSVSRDEPYRDLKKDHIWISDYNVEFLWVDEELFKKYGYYGTVYHRLTVKSEADIVILADADLFVANDFDKTILDAFNHQKLLGFTAHVSPFMFYNPNTPSKIWWKKLFDEAGLVLPSFNNVHTGWGLTCKDEGHRSCPNYFNYGFIVSPRKYLEQMATSFTSEMDIVDKVVLDTPFKAQLANTLCFVRYGIPCGTLSINCNFPLHAPYNEFRALNPDPEGKNSVEDIKIFHYLSTGRFNKEDFQTIESLENALQRTDLNEAETVFQRKLQFVHNKIISTE